MHQNKANTSGFLKKVKLKKYELPFFKNGVLNEVIEGFSFKNRRIPLLMLTNQNKSFFIILINQNNIVHQNKAKFRKFPWKRLLWTAVRFSIFSNIQLINKKFGSNIDGHMMEQFWKNEKWSLCLHCFWSYNRKTSMKCYKRPYFRDKRVYKGLPSWNLNTQQAVKSE